MAELPSGTVTFLFSDVEGSTRLLTRLRGRYAEVLGEHQRLLRAAFDAHDGREVHTEGDAFFVAFARASDAIAAAVSAQRALASERWPEGVDVRVRMGVHTGEAEVRQDDYVGLDVHRAARICAAGHGGQVLISSSTRELVADELPHDVALRDLGEHRLKDLDRPEHLFQVVVGDLPADFPPLASLSPGSGGANGLPPSPNRTIGRDDDVRAIADRLRVDGVRLLTLTGPGGVGKTRLGLEAARAVKADFADGAHFVSLAALRRPEDVPAAIVKTLAIVVLSGESADQAAERFLAAKHLLLVLDNFEHVLAAAPFIGRLLDACPALTVLATSREPLGLHAEERYPVSPLALPARATPEDADALAGVDAVALFCAARARPRPRLRPGRRQRGRRVAEICRRVDGLPLAIELAAARCGLLSPDEIAERLDDALGALGAGARDAPARQQTLRATIDWSHELLSDDREAVLRALRGVRRRRDGAGRRDDHARRPRHARRPGRQEPSRPPPARARAHAGWGCSTRSAPTPTERFAADRRRATPSASATIATTSRWLSATEPTGRSGARTARSTSRGSTPRSTTSTRLSAWAVDQPRRRTGARDGAQRSAGTGSCEIATPTR